jgi:integrase
VDGRPATHHGQSHSSHHDTEGQEPTSSAVRSDSGYLFVNEAGVEYHPHRFTKMFEDSVKRAGVPKIRLHDTRHTMATLALEAGVHPKVVQEQLGHSAVAVTLDTYSHVPQAVRRDSADKIAGLFGD